jgi:predicted amidohydrolase
MNIAAIQLEICDNKNMSGRIKDVDFLLSGIYNGQTKPDLVLLPELWGAGFFNFNDYARNSEPLKGKTFEFLAAWAVKLQAVIHGGSIIESDGRELFNTSLLIGEDGSLLASYRKMHLFGYKSRENKILTKGTSPVTVKTGLGVLGLSTCYDLRFPEQYRRMADHGAEIFLVTSAWPEPRLEHWRLFNQARAVENQCWLISCNCSGIQGGVGYAGHSMTVSPSGRIAAEAGKEACILWSVADLAEVHENRREFPFLADRFSI